MAVASAGVVNQGLPVAAYAAQPAGFAYAPQPALVRAAPVAYAAQPVLKAAPAVVAKGKDQVY